MMMMMMDSKISRVLFILSFCIYCIKGLPVDKNAASTDIEYINKLAGWQDDIYIPDEEKNDTSSRRKRRDTFGDKGFHIWPNGTVPFVLRDFDEIGRQKVLFSMFEMETKTCIRFVDLTGVDEDELPTYFISIEAQNPWKGCWSFPGRWRVKGGQSLSLYHNSSEPETSCLTKTIIQHELIHALGFFHEQSRKDRDDFVEVIWDNIEEGAELNFMKIPIANDLGEDYDPDSIMHYDRYQFSINGNATLLWKADHTRPLGGKVMTEIDLRQIRKMYLETCKNDPNKKSPSFNRKFKWLFPGCSSAFVKFFSYCPSYCHHCIGGGRRKTGFVIPTTGDDDDDDDDDDDVVGNTEVKTQTKRRYWFCKFRNRIGSSRRGWRMPRLLRKRRSRRSRHRYGHRYGR